MLVLNPVTHQYDFDVASHSQEIEPIEGLKHVLHKHDINTSVEYCYLTARTNLECFVAINLIPNLISPHIISKIFLGGIPLDSFSKIHAEYTLHTRKPHSYLHCMHTRLVV